MAASAPVDEAVINALTKMVDERLTAEFEKRDEMILSLKAGMDQLVNTLKNGNSPKLTNGSPQPPSRGGSRGALVARARGVKHEP